MTTRRMPFANEEYYHVYNRGVDKREIFQDRYDVDRFFRSMIAFNTINPVGSLRHVDLERKNSGSTSVNHEPLVEIIAYCLNPNHFHLLLKQKVDGGVSEFMRRLAGGYTWYFNNKYDRSGVLFQGRFKSSHIDVNEYFLHVSVYVNLNFRVHKYRDKDLENILSSWDEYMDMCAPQNMICTKNSVLGQFKSKKAYENFAEKSLIGILEHKKLAQELIIEE
jgi:putative transposase